MRPCPDCIDRDPEDIPYWCETCRGNGTLPTSWFTERETKEKAQMAAQPRDLEARRAAFAEASGYTDTRVADVHRALSALEDYTHEIVHDGEECDPDRLRVLTRAALTAADELEGIAYQLHDVANERNRQARETLVAASEPIVVEAPQGGFAKLLRISSQTEDGRWWVEHSATSAPTLNWSRFAVSDFDLAKALRYACGFYDRSPSCDALAEEIVKGLLDAA